MPGWQCQGCTAIHGGSVQPPAPVGLALDLGLGSKLLSAPQREIPFVATRLRVSQRMPFANSLLTGRWAGRYRGVAWLTFAGILGMAVVFAYRRYHLKRFQEVRRDVFYRSSQPSELGLQHLIKGVGIKTVISLQLFDYPLKSGVVDLGESDGELESDFVHSLHARHLQWPMGDEACWPWPSPWHLEQFFKIMDDPDNWPVYIHCMGGRHRTGTLCALFRMEYDGWTVEDALQEMYSFSFGQAIAIQEMNLRTFVPRPRPNDDELQALRAHLAPGSTHADEEPTYANLVRQLRNKRGQGEVEEALQSYLSERLPFALPLAVRLIDTANDPLLPFALRHAAATLEDERESYSNTLSAAALIADFGQREAQAHLLSYLSDKTQASTNPRRWEALAFGVAGRYTSNRIPYLEALLDLEDSLPTKGAAMFRYCDLAVGRLCVIADQNFLSGTSHQGEQAWNTARVQGRRWIDSNSQVRELTGLTQPWGADKPLRPPESIGQATPSHATR